MGVARKTTNDFKSFHVDHGEIWSQHRNIMESSEHDLCLEYTSCYL